MAAAFPYTCTAEDIITLAAQVEAKRLYPDLGIEGSDANKMFLKAVEDAKQSKDRILSQLDWPIAIAEKIFRPICLSR